MVSDDIADTDANAGIGTTQVGLSVSAAPHMSKTPMFQAIHAQRYQRQSLIKTITADTGRPLLCYISGTATSIDRDDTVFLVDLLHNVAPGSDLDFMLHTGGGDIDAAEKLISVVRTCVGSGRLRMIVPDYAKSAGTLMALGADEILMSDTSELGPIDPQITLDDGNGNLIPHSVQSYLDAYAAHSSVLQKDPNNIAARIMLGKLDPATLKVFEAVRERARRFAETQLKRGMCAATGNYTAAAAKLIDTNKWLTHGQMIGWQDATDIGLCVKYLEPSNPEWQRYWQLYCYQRLAIKDREKIFESEYASLITESSS
jgi:Serine dehydrogenase proteinase